MLNSMPIIPKTQQIIESGGFFVVNPESGISYEDAGESAGEFLCSLTGLKKSQDGNIVIKHDPSVTNPEEYELVIDNNGITILASSASGFFYGAQTLRQLLPAEVESNGIKDLTNVPCLLIKDKPRFSYRGFMLDSARHFFPIETIKKMLDLMAFHKLNRFHWHLTDDQGFRIEIKKFPLLTEIGSKRGKSQIGGRPLWGEKTYDDTPHSGYYTQEQIKEIVYYAKSLFIEVIPEIDIPGHFMAALAAYPEYSCTGGPFEVGTKWGIYKDILCAGKESSYTFIEGILSEIIGLFPYKQIHIGGDETPKDRWKKCPDCQAMMEKNNIKSEELLLTYFINRISKYLKSRGCTVIGWDEIVSDSLNMDTVIQYWSPVGARRAIASLKAGRKCIFSPFRKYYLDYSYEFIPLRKSYDFDPYLKEIPKEAQNKIIGIEAPLWTEYVDSEDRLFWQTFPRLSAISETAWTDPGLKSYDDFLIRFRYLQKRLDIWKVNSASWDCYSYDKSPKSLKLLYSNEHPAVKEYNKYK